MQNKNHKKKIMKIQILMKIKKSMKIIIKLMKALKKIYHQKITIFQQKIQIIIIMIMKKTRKKLWKKSN